MSVLRFEVRPGAYCDSIVLLKVQKGLAERPGVIDASAVMATVANLEILAAQGLAPAGLPELASDDLLAVVRANSEDAATAALAALPELLAARSGGGEEEDFQPKSLATAGKLLPEARWVLVSVPGRFAARVAREALASGRNVFLFSDNVPLEDEVALKRDAAERGLLVMGPDCGTAMIAGVGFGFANHVRRGAVGIVAASGTGLQAVASRLHALGAGISHALGTGGRDLSAEVAGTSARQALDLLARDPVTEVIVLISKPPAPEVAACLLGAARAAGKPCVVCFLGYSPPTRRQGNLRFAVNLDEAAELALEPMPGVETPGSSLKDQDLSQGIQPLAQAAPPLSLRALFAGGTLAYEAILGLAPFLGEICSNLEATGARPLAELGRSQGHTVLDLGDDAFTQGRLHPMMDQDLRLRRFRQEAADPEVGLILLDFVLGESAHPDPASVWAPEIVMARTARPIEVLVLLIGTDEDPQGCRAQARALEEAGAAVVKSPRAAVDHVLSQLAPPPLADLPPVPASALASPLAAINVGLASFHQSLLAQGASAVQVDWRPPAGGNEQLLSLLDQVRRLAA